MHVRPDVTQTTRPWRVSYVICVTKSLITINFTLDNFFLCSNLWRFVETLEHTSKSFCSFVSRSYLFTCLHNVLDKWLDTISVGKKTPDHLHRNAREIHGQEKYVHTMILKKWENGMFSLNSIVLTWIIMFLSAYFVTWVYCLFESWTARVKDCDDIAFQAM